MANKLLSLIIALLLIPLVIFADDPFAQAEKLAADGKTTEAIQLFNKIKQTYPNSDWSLLACFNLAKLYEKTGKLDSAIAEYKKIITDYPKKTQAEEAFFQVARLRGIQKDRENAIKAYRAYLDKYPNGQYRVMALFNTASLLRDSGSEEQALKYYGDILNGYAGETWFYSWAAIYSGHINFGNKQYDKAISFYERVIKKEDNKSLYTLSNLYIGLSLMQKKDYEAAKGIFGTLLKTSKYYSEEAMIGLASAYYKAGEYDMAKEVFDTFMQTFPGSVWVDYVKKRIKRTEAKLANPNDKGGDE